MSFPESRLSAVKKGENFIRQKLPQMDLNHLCGAKSVLEGGGEDGL